MLRLDDVSLRPVSEQDLARLREWRNAEGVRRYMYTDHIISEAEHRRWFESWRGRNDIEHMIAELAGHGPAGIVSITDIDRQHGTCFWAFYADPNNPIRGIGRLMEIRAIDRMIGHHGVRKINCEVLAFNEAVVRLHKSFGFVEEGVFRWHKVKDGRFEDVVRLALFADEWPQHRARALEPRPAAKTEGASHD